MRPKLWDGANAVGEAKERHLQAIGAPYLTASGPGFVARKMGAFSEVTGHPITPEELLDEVFAHGYINDTTAESVGAPLRRKFFTRAFGVPSFLGVRFSLFADMQGEANETYDDHPLECGENVPSGQSYWNWNFTARIYKGGFAGTRVLIDTLKAAVSAPSFNYSLGAHSGLSYFLGQGIHAGGMLGALGVHPNGQHAAFFGYSASDGADPAGAPVERARIRIYLEDGSILRDVPLVTDGHRTTVPLVIQTAPGEMLAICLALDMPLIKGYPVSGTGQRIRVYRVSNFGETVALANPLAELGEIYPKIDPDIGLPLSYHSPYNLQACVFKMVSRAAMLDNEHALLVTPGFVFESSTCAITQWCLRFYILSADGATSSKLAQEISLSDLTGKPDERTETLWVHHMCTLGGGVALLALTDMPANEYDYTQARIWFYEISAKGVVKLDPKGFPESATKSIHFGHFTAIAPYKQADSDGLVFMPVWSGESYDLYESRDVGRTWKKSGVIRKTDYFKELDDAPNSLFSWTSADRTVAWLNFGDIKYLGSRKFPSRLDPVIEGVYGDMCA